MTDSSGLQPFLDAAVATGIPGISVAVANATGSLWTGTAGVADLRERTLVRSDHLFGIGSITKTFVAALVLQLVEEGRLDLGDTCAAVLGEVVQGIPNADVASVAELLNHTSGIPSWEDDPAWIRAGRGDLLDVRRRWGKTDTLDYVRGHPPLAEPGTRFAYANTNFTLLGMLVEAITGNELVAEIDRRILVPLAIEDIFLEGFEPVPASRLAGRYHWITPEFRATAGVNAAFHEVRAGLLDVCAANLSVEWAAGGIVATAAALASFGVGLRDGRLLEPHSMRFMTRWRAIGTDAGGSLFRDLQIGHNLLRRSYQDAFSIVGHPGDVLGSSGSLFWVEDGDAVMAVLCNVGSMHAGDVPAVAYSVGMDQEFICAARRLIAVEQVR